MENLKKIQKISKILYILSKIFFILSIVGCVSCILGSIVFAVWGKDPIIIQMITDLGEQLDYNLVLCTLICGAVECGTMIALYFYVKNFYKKELELNSPFKAELVKDLKLVGILHIVLPFVSLVVCQIIAVCFGADLVLFDTSNIIIGLIYLIMIPIISHGAEITMQNISIKTEERDNL